MLGFLQRNNLKALYLAATADSEKLEQKLENQSQKRAELLEEYGLTAPGTVSKPDQTEPSGAEQPSGSSGQSQSPSQPEKDNSTAAGQPAQQPSQQPSQQPAQQPEKSGELSEDAKNQIQAYVDELYALEDLYVSKLDEIVEATKKEYRALPKAERTKEKKLALVKSKTETLIAEEKTCDAAVEEVLAKIQAVLDENGVKNNLVPDIRARYEESKATWKAARMTELYK